MKSLLKKSITTPFFRAVASLFARAIASEFVRATWEFIIIFFKK